jgi:hypothetical protein
VFSDFFSKSTLKSSKTCKHLLTNTAATFAIHIKLPSFITGALDRVLVLLTHLTTLQMMATVIHNFTGFIVCLELKSLRAGTDNSSSGNNRTVVATASIIQRTFIYNKGNKLEVMPIVFLS